MRPYAGLNRNLNFPGFCMPTVNFSQRSVDSLREVHALSGNSVGNFIHNEAMPRILDYDAAGSAMFDLNSAVRLRGADRVADVISERYDVLVFSCANLIKPKVSILAEIEVLRKLKIQVVIFGAGIQEEMREGFSGFSESLIDFLYFANMSAVLFGVRDDLTANFLAGQRLHKAEPLGCLSFNARCRDELLNGEIFYSLREAKTLIEQWRIHYNSVRPHSALGYRPPAMESIVPMDQRPTMHLQ